MPESPTPLVHNYDGDDRLTSVTNRATFLYDGLGRCVKRTIDGVTLIFTYDEWQQIGEWNGNGSMSALNLYGAGADEILYRYDAMTGQRYRYHHDQHGNVTFILNWWGGGLERYTYDAFGYPTVTDWNGSNPRQVSAVGNRFMFQGREWLQPLGLYDFRHRMYQPHLGHFLQKDPKGFEAGDMNLFRYCGGDPVNGSDPAGLINDWQREKAFFGDSTVPYADQMDNMAPRRAEPAGNDGAVAEGSESRSRGHVGAPPIAVDPQDVVDGIRGRGKGSGERGQSLTSSTGY